MSAPAGAEALLLIDAESGKVLHAENSTQPWYPASVTKLMTAYVTLRAVKERRLTLDTLLPVSPNAVAQAPSKMGFKTGTTVTVDNALKMLMVKSANDVAVVLAEGVSGSIEKFADDMNRAAARLGMVQTTYVNPNGLPADGQITSARDQAILARAMIREMPEYELYWRISAIKFGKRVMRNYNTLIDRYPGADGMKTGFICASGFNLVASATRNNKRLIAVVLGAYSGPVRAVKAAQMLERGFQQRRLQLAHAFARQCRGPRADQGRAAEPARRYVRQEAQASGRRERGRRFRRRANDAGRQRLPAFDQPCQSAREYFEALDPDRRADAVDGADRGVHRRDATGRGNRGRRRAAGRARKRRSRQRPPSRRRKEAPPTAPAFATTPPAYPSTSAFTPRAGRQTGGGRGRSGAGRNRKSQPSRPTNPPINRRTRSRRRPSRNQRRSRTPPRRPQNRRRSRPRSDRRRAIAARARTADSAHAPHRLSRRRQDHAAEPVARRRVAERHRRHHQ